MENISGYAEKKARVESYNQQIIEFGDIVSEHWIDPPSFDLSKTYAEFSDGLRVVQSDDRKGELNRFVDAHVGEELNSWMAKVNPLRETRRRVDDFQRLLETEESEIRALITSHRNNESEEKEKLNRLESDAVRSKATISHLKSPSKMALVTFWVFIVGVVLLALGTAYYYLGTQGQIIVAQAGGPGVYFDDEEATFSVAKFIQHNPMNLVYGFGAIIFFLMGKVAGVVYEKMHYPRWLLLTVAISVVGVVGGTAVLVADASQKAFRLNGAVSTAYSAREDLLFYTQSTGVVPNCNLDGDAQLSVCITLNEAELELAEKRDATGGMTYWVTLSVLLAEILVGSFTWMYAGDFDRSHARNSGDEKKRLALIEEHISQQKRARNEVATETRFLDEALSDLVRQKAKVSTIMAKIPNGDQIARTREDIVKKEQAKGYTQLLKVMGSWPST